MKADTAFGYQVANWGTGDAPNNNNWIQAENWGGEDDALLFNNEDLPALGSIPGTH